VSRRMPGRDANKTWKGPPNIKKNVVLHQGRAEKSDGEGRGGGGGGGGGGVGGKRGL